MPASTYETTEEIIIPEIAEVPPTIATSPAPSILRKPQKHICVSFAKVDKDFGNLLMTRLKEAQFSVINCSELKLAAGEL